MRLPDVNFSRPTLVGYPEPAPSQTPPIQYWQGEDILFEIFLAIYDKPIDSKLWTLAVVVKSDAYAIKPAWSGLLHNGLVAKEPTGYYQILIPKAATQDWYAGTYWVDIMGTNIESNLSSLLLRQPFNFDYTSASPNPSYIALGNPDTTAPNIVSMNYGIRLYDGYIAGNDI